MKLKIIFLGTGKFGTIIFQGLIENGYRPIWAYDFKKIRTCLANARQNLDSPKYKHKNLELKQVKPDLVIVASYGKIIPKEILKIPQYGCLNIHASLLPKYRGPSPIQTAILNEDKETGVTIILMDEKIDHGKIISNSKFLISKKFTYQELSQKLAELGAKLLIETIPKWIKGEIKAKPQDESKATYTKILKRKDGEIDWSKPGREIERQIRAFNPWPGAFFFIKHKGKILRVKVLEAKAEDNKLIIKKLQPEGKKPMTFEEFQRGYHGLNPI